MPILDLGNKKERIMNARYVVPTGLLIAAIAIHMPTFSKPARASVSEGKTSFLSERYGKIPLFFVKNEGQMDSRVRFYERSRGCETFFTDDSIVFAVTRATEGPFEGPSSGLEEGPPRQPGNSHLIRLTPLGMQRNVHLSAEDAQAGKTNYFIGDDPDRWRTDIPTYRSLVYRDAYPGVDFKFYGNNQQLEYDIMVQPGADLSRVRLQYSGIDRLEITDTGDLIIHVTAGLTLTQRKPVAYQVIEGKRVELTGTFRIGNEALGSTPLEASDGVREGSPEAVQSHPSTTNDQGHVFGFEVASYDRRYPLVIDPILIYSSYLGGIGSDYGYALAVDASGQVTLTGHTLSHDFPTQEPFHGPYGGTYAKVFVTKLNAAGDALVYSTYLGGNGRDYGYGIALDEAGNTYIAGYTDSTNFPKKNAYQKARAGGWDAFVTKLGPDGKTLVYSTYLGGTKDEGATAIAVDSRGQAYITGRTASRKLPLVSPFQPQFGGGESDAFVAKFNAAGKGLIYSTYLGGNDRDGGSAIAVDSSGNAYVTGTTRSSNFLLENPFQNTRMGSQDAFLLKLNPAGDALVYSTYLGGADQEEGRGVAVDSSGSAYVTGATRSADFPVKNPGPGREHNAGSFDGFITKFSPGGNAISYSTYLGGAGADYGSAIAVDTAFNAYVSGHTASRDFPLEQAFDTEHGSLWDGFVAKLNASGNELIYSSYLGGSNDDYGRAIAVDAAGYAYVTGWTHSDDFPVTPNALQPVKAGAWDAFITKINNTNFNPPVAAFSAKPKRGQAPLTVKFKDSSTGNITAWQWDFGDNQTSSDRNPTHIYVNSGTYTVALTTSGPGGNNTRIRPTYIIADAQPGISAVAPNGGEIWPLDSTQTIRWSYTGNPGSFVRIELLMNGLPVSTIKAAIAIGKDGTGSCSWTIPSSRVPGDKYKISLTTNEGSTDLSDGNFTIDQVGSYPN
jgi:PKD repeat protein